MTLTGRALTTSAVTLVLGAAVSAWTISLPPGDPRFDLGTAALAGVWLGGALLTRWAVGSGPLRPRRSLRQSARDGALGIGVGAALAALFLLGAGLVVLVPSLRTPVEGLLAHASEGTVWLVLALTLLAGAAEELFFRGALFDALAAARPAVTTTLLYTLVVASAGIWLLAVAGLVLGSVCARLRVRTGGTTAPVFAHITWSAGMFFLLSPALDLWS